MGKNRKLSFLTLSLALSSGTILTDRYIAPIPDWLGIVLALSAAASLIAFL